jgi:rhodanese-related sulfurtransferase
MKDTVGHTLFGWVMVSSVLAATLSLAVLSSSAANIQQIKPEALMKLIEEKDPTILVVDVQPKEVYDAGHIQGAINFPWAPEINNPGTLPRDKTLILYCDCAQSGGGADLAKLLTPQAEMCVSDDDSVDVAEQLISRFGYKNVKVLEGGWAKWQQLVYPVDKKAP